MSVFFVVNVEGSVSVFGDGYVIIIIILVLLDHPKNNCWKKYFLTRSLRIIKPAPCTHECVTNVSFVSRKKKVLGLQTSTHLWQSLLSSSRTIFFFVVLPKYHYTSVCLKMVIFKQFVLNLIHRLLLDIPENYLCFPTTALLYIPCSRVDQLFLCASGRFCFAAAVVCEAWHIIRT